MSVYTVISPVADVFGAADRNALRGKFETQLVFGEAFSVTDIRDGWARGHCVHDGYAGHIEARHLSAATPDDDATTHIVTAIRSFTYRDATMKSPRISTLCFGSRVTAGASDNGYTQINGGNWIYSKHLSPAGTLADPVLLAQQFLEVPYFWGGRSGFGIDCSGLMQIIMAQAGIALPRDTEEQSATGTEKTTAARGDLVFFPGHVGIMADDDTIIHANAFHMKVTQEPLTDVDSRSKGITAIRGF